MVADDEIYALLFGLGHLFDSVDAAVQSYDQRNAFTYSMVDAAD